MADKRSHAEIREDIEKEDRSKDVHIHLGVFIATLAGISAAGGGLATLSVTFLGAFREDVGNFWMSCVPFIFPFITGVSLAYRKQLASVGIHLALLLGVVLAGGAGYGFAVQPIYFNRNNCTAVSEDVGNCDKEILVMLYVCAGAVACAFGVIGLLVSLCACSSASKKRAQREAALVLAMERQIDSKNKAVKKVHQSAPRPSVIPTATTNGNTAKTNGTAAVDATTHL